MERNKHFYVWYKSHRRIPKEENKGSTEEEAKWAQTAITR